MKKPAIPAYADELWLDETFVDEQLTKMGWGSELSSARGMMAKRLLAYIVKATRAAKKEHRNTMFARSMRYQFPFRKHKGALSAGSILRFLGNEKYQGRVYLLAYIQYDYTDQEYEHHITQLRTFMQAVMEAA